MITLCNVGIAAPLCRGYPQLCARSALEHRTFVARAFLDLRLALAALVGGALVQVSDAIVRGFMARAWKGARFAQDSTAAATMVAAACR